MNRQQKITEARKLRAKGLLYREIGERLGITEGCAQKWCNSEAAKKYARKANAKRRVAKREWEAGKCPKCGGRVAKAAASGHCAKCEREQRQTIARERAERFIARRKAGLLNHQIAEEEGVSHWVVATVFSRADRWGLTVPPSPYHT